MARPWICIILITSSFLLCCLRSQAVRTRQPYFRGEKVLRLKNFSEARKLVKKKDLDLLKLWESMLTGRSAPLSRLIKNQYKSLGLSHVFTPSGFHLSAVLLPILYVIRGPRPQLILLMLLGVGITTLPGFSALKRMILIKMCQRLFDLKLGFILALALDIIVGTFQTNTVSFTYSFLFLGIIYAGISGLRLVIWFFIAQIFLAYFQGQEISPLLLLISPALNLIFTGIMPLLFILAIPLVNWQREVGISILSWVQQIVSWCANLASQVPTVEVNIVTLLLVGLFVFGKRRMIPPLLLVFSVSLNSDIAREPGAPANEFVTIGTVEEVVYGELENIIRFSDGKCRYRLVRGYWYESCSPRRKSRRQKYAKKLSYPSSEIQRSFLHGWHT